MLIYIFLLYIASAKIYFKEIFSDASFDKRWVVSDWKKAAGKAGRWGYSAGRWYGDRKVNKGLRTTQDSRHYAISAKFDEPFNTKGKDLVIQYSLKHEQKIECGGGYIKLYPDGLNQKRLSHLSNFTIMFGPDICGRDLKRVNVLFRYKERDIEHKKYVRCEDDQLTHVYTLILTKRLQYRVLIDGEEKDSGRIDEDWDFLLPRVIKDPLNKKPWNWPKYEIDDPAHMKPRDWHQPREVHDPNAKKPHDWSDKHDGEWVAPMIDNPDYNGEWKPRQKRNPDYKGDWVDPEIFNPDFEHDDEYHVFHLNYVGIEVWQTKAGSIFDNIIITDNIDEAEDLLDETYYPYRRAEEIMFNRTEEKRIAKETASQKKKEEEEIMKRLTLGEYEGLHEEL